MPPKSVLIRAAVGATLIGIGIAVMLSATRELDRMHEVDAETTADEVAAASAEMAEARPKRVRRAAVTEPAEEVAEPPAPTDD